MTEGVTIDVTVNGTEVSEKEALVLLTQVALVVTVSETDCSCDTELAVVLKVLPVAPDTFEPFILH